METGTEQEIKIVAWINVVAVEVMRNSIWIYLILEPTRFSGILDMKSGRRSGVNDVFLKTLA